MKIIGTVKKILTWTIIGVLLLYILFPFYWAINSSLQSGAELFEVHFLPQHWAWENYKAIFQEQPFGRHIANSLLVASLTVFLSIGVAFLAAYPLARQSFKGRGFLLMTVLGVSMFPQVAVLAGLYEILRSMGLYNHPLGLVFSYMIFTLPFTVWILTSFMRTLPYELEEAALMDGANRWQILWKIFLPLLAPALVTTAILGFIGAWNEFLFALTFTLTHDTRTVPVAISMMSGASVHEIPWGRIMAASVVVTLPLILLVLVGQRRIIAGLTAGAVKG